MNNSERSKVVVSVDRSKVRPCKKTYTYKDCILESFNHKGIEIDLDALMEEYDSISPEYGATMRKLIASDELVIFDPERSSVKN